MFTTPGQPGAKPQASFSFGGTATNTGAPTTGFAFGAAGTTSTGAETITSASGFTQGGTPAAAQPTAQVTNPFSFGTGAAPTQTPFNFMSGGTTTAAPSNPAPNISLGTPGLKPGGMFGAPPSTATVTAPTLPSYAAAINFGGATGASSTTVKPTAPATQGLFFQSNAASVTTSATTASAFGNAPLPFTTVPQSTGSSFGAPAPLSGQVLGATPKLGATPTTTMGFGTPVSRFGGGLTKTMATTTGTGTMTTSSTLGGIATTAGTTGIILGSFGPVAPTTATASVPSTVQTTQSTGGTVASSTPQLSYKQLEEQINKWVSDLEDYERTFLDQAAQVNAWDRLLMENGEKITELNGNVENVKAEQKRLDEELDFILAQQQELEVLLKPLEEELQKRTTGPGQLQHADREREFTYGLAKEVDGQLKQMVGDLKSIIDHLNTAGSTQQESNDPIIQVAKILNAHMNSLQWIDQNAALLQRKVDEVSSLSEIRRKEQERNFRLAFD